MTSFERKRSVFQSASYSENAYGVNERRDPVETGLLRDQPAILDGF